jgi:hypothetical protein
MTRRRARADEHPADKALVAPAAPEVGWLVPGSKPTALLVDFPSNERGPLAARTTAAIDAATLERAVSQRQGVLLQFERGQADLPIVVGLIQSAEPSLVELLLSSAPPAAVQKAAGGTTVAQARLQEARLDGKRVVLEAEHEVVLRCGKASITLTQDGKVVVRGAYVETRSQGVNRIKGGTVKIN